MEEELIAVVLSLPLVILDECLRVGWTKSVCVFLRRGPPGNPVACKHDCPRIFVQWLSNQTSEVEKPSNGTLFSTSLGENLDTVAFGAGSSGLFMKLSIHKLQMVGHDAASCCHRSAPARDERPRSAITPMREVNGLLHAAVSE
jgi:hypothetical protein